MRHISYIVIFVALLTVAPAQGQRPPRNANRQEVELRDDDGYRIHVAKPGETIYSLSRMYGVTREALIELNGLYDGLKAGAVIRIPGSAPTPPTSPENEVRTEPVRESEYGLPEWGNRRSPDYEIPKVALMLPLENAGAAAGNDFTEFYKGALLALEDLKAAGHSLDMTLYNSARSADKVLGIVTSSDFAGTDLIIGPVYEDEMVPALQYAGFFDVPIVSPLAPAGQLDSEMLYHMSPDPSARYDKVRTLFGEGKNIILVSSGAGEDDAEFEREMAGQLGAGNYGRFTIGAGEVSSLIDWERENVFVVLAGTQLAADRALATISSSYNNASARRSRRADITVVGSSRWGSYNIDKNLLFKLNVHFVTSYYIHRSEGGAARFERRYLEAYGDFPTRAAYRGYDAVALFAGALFRPGYSFDDRLSGVGAAPLGTPYRFVRTDGRASRTNDQWTLVRFKDDYNVTIQ